MAISLSDPTIWSARVLGYLDKTLIYKAAFTNNDYEGEAKSGGTVKSFYLSDVSVTDYTGTWDDTDWTELTDNEKSFTIDQLKKVLAKIPDVSQQFSVLNLIDQGSKRIAYAIGDIIDQFVASKYSQIASANTYGNDTTPIVVGLGSGEIKPTIFLNILMERLIDAKAPRTNANVVIPSWMGTMLDIELGNRQTALGDAAVQGQLDMPDGMVMQNVAGFKTVYVSSNIPNTSGAKFKVMAGEKMITYASAIEKFQIVPLQNDFAQGMKGLYVYGGKLLRGEFMSLGTVNKGSYE
ncbi:MAG: hypothetical protein ABIR47_07455 [Candidatus Kapaibacterium sp.]